MRFLGSSGRSETAGCLKSPVGVPANTELESGLGIAAPPFGDIDLDPGGVEVEANNDDTEALALLYGKLEVDEAGD